MLESGEKLHKNYVPELDGLRGIAIILVVTFHYLGFRFTIFSIGWSGVDLFFVLSGYLITSRLISSIHRKNYFSRFYLNRVLRLFPLYYAVLICFYFILPLFISREYFHSMAFYRENAVAFFTFFENWVFMGYPDLKENHLIIFWSLGVEEQFYLIWPLFIFYFYKVKRIRTILGVWIILCIVLRVILYRMDNSNYQIYLYNTFCRMDSFIIGAFLFFVHKEILKPAPRYIVPVNTVILIAGIIIWGTSVLSPFIATVGLTSMAIFYAGIIDIAVKRKYKWFTTLLNRKWLIFTGKISYGLYIFHWLVIRFCYAPVYRTIHSYWDIPDKVNVYLTLFICCLASVVVSVLSFKYFESYFLKLKMKGAIPRMSKA
ncbi:MAG: acyltransferase [Chitinophagales bacterium]|nr:acyltransferase [Chitinophagales bacterium]